MMARRCSLAAVYQVVVTACLYPGAARHRSATNLDVGSGCTPGISRFRDRVAQDMDRRGVEDDRYMCICVMEALTAEGLVRLSAHAMTHLNVTGSAQLSQLAAARRTR
jgi:hypothetical protein